MDMDDIFSDITLTAQCPDNRPDGLPQFIVSCKMDGVDMPARRLTPKQTVFIGPGPHSRQQRLWAARMAYRDEMRRNQRVQGLYIRKDRDGGYLVRCRIDGAQQLSSRLTRNEVDMLRRGVMTERELVERHYSRVLQENTGKVLDRTGGRNITLGISRSKIE